MNSALSPLRLSVAQRSVPNPYRGPGNGPASTGSVGVPPWTHNALRLAWSRWAVVSWIVVAPAISWPGTSFPAVSSRFVEASVTIELEYGFVTTDSDPQLSLTARVL